MSDREMDAVLVTLEPLGDRIFPWIDVAGRSCDFARLRRIGWSSGERALLEWAEALWKGTGKVDIGYVANGLGGPFFAAVMCGLAVYRGEDLPAVRVHGDGTATAVR